jgi:dethiobiotin synthetase
MIKGIFITGTDTGVGKTYVAMLLARSLKGRGIDVGVMKPAETGCRRRNGELIPLDAVNLMKAAGVHDPLAEVNPYRFSKPLAPSVAAELEQKRVDPRKIVREFTSLSKKHGFMIVEGAGGIMVPLTNRYAFLDLAADLKLPVIVVARPGLGTINHTLLTVNALNEKKLPILGIVINYAENRRTGTAEKTSPLVIKKLSGLPVLAVLRHGSDHIEGLTHSIAHPGS